MLKQLSEIGPWAQFYTSWQTSLLSKNWVEHQSQQHKHNVLLAGNLFLLSNTPLCLASCCAYRLYEIEPCTSRIIGLSSNLCVCWVFFCTAECRAKGRGNFEGSNLNLLTVLCKNSPKLGCFWIDGFISGLRVLLCHHSHSHEVEVTNFGHWTITEWITVLK